MVETATSLMIKQRWSESAKAHALHHLLHRLKRFVRVYARDEGDHPLPDHDVEWVTELDDGPARIIHEAMPELPALWIDALPEGVCIVPVANLKKLVGDAAAGYLSEVGKHLVESEGARLQHERMVSEYERR